MTISQRKLVCLSPQLAIFIIEKNIDSIKLKFSLTIIKLTVIKKCKYQGKIR